MRFNVMWGEKMTSEYQARLFYTEVAVQRMRFVMSLRAKRRNGGGKVQMTHLADLTRLQKMVYLT